MATTSIASPLTLTTIQQTVARAIAGAPEQRSRIQRALPLILQNHCQQTAADEFTVESATTIGVCYIVTPSSCECEGWRRDQSKWCSHQWACRILLAARQQQDCAPVTLSRVA